MYAVRLYTSLSMYIIYRFSHEFSVQFDYYVHYGVKKTEPLPAGDGPQVRGMVLITRVWS
jgi:hypothetical protein